MRSVLLTSILISPNRHRREFEPQAQAELIDSIRTHGLLHPPVVRLSGGGELILVAGERRLRAIRDLWMTGGTLRSGLTEYPEGTLPVLELGELSHLQAEEAELEENIRRKDLTWQERASAVERLARLRAEQAARDGNVPPTLADIARESFVPKRSGFDVGDTGYGIDQTHKQIAVARGIERNPELGKARSLEDAYKILVRTERLERNAQLALEMGSTYSRDSHSLLLGDCFEMPLEVGRFSCIITDPPYGINADEFQDAGGSAVPLHRYVDTKENFDAIFDRLPGFLYSLASNECHLYLFLDIDRFVETRDRFAAYGWQTHRTPFIWHKPNGNRVPWPQSGPQRKHELLMYAIKGGKSVNIIGGDVLTFPSDENLGLSAQKPVALYEELLKRSCKPGDQVLDPFCGTGPLFPAAHSQHVYSTGIEIDPASYAIAAQRIRDLK